MCADPSAEVSGREMLDLVPLDVVSDLLLDGRQVVEPPAHLVRHPDTCEVCVSLPIAEPAAHLKQSVVGGGRTDEERDGETLERQSSRESVAAHGDDDARVLVI